MAGPTQSSDGFIGRERELGLLCDALERARTGSGGLVLVAGEPGIGKTRLTAELIGRSDTPTLHARAWEGGSAPEYWPWVQIVRAYLAHVPPGVAQQDLGPHASVLAEMVPELGERTTGIARGRSADAERARFLLFEAVSAFLRRAAERRPLLIVLDDLHWADGPSLALLQRIARSLEGIAALVVATHRDAEVARSVELARHVAALARYASAIRLEGLGSEEVGTLLADRLGSSVSPKLAAVAHRMTAGNPFFVDETARMLRSSGRSPEAILENGFPVLPGARTVVRRRLARLDETTHELLGVASVIGPEFDLGLLRRATDVDSSTLLERLEEAAAASFVRSSEGALGWYAFVHDLVRDALYADLPRPKRLELHARIGELLEDGTTHHAEVGHHYLLADPDRYLGRAVETLARAGRHALDMVAYESAAGHFEQALRALELHERMGLADAVDATRCELLIGLGEAQTALKEVEEARRTFARAVELARGLCDGPLLARAALGSRWAWFHHSTLVESEPLRLLEEGLEALGDEEPALRVRLLAALCELLVFEPAALERRDALSREALDIADSLGDDETLLHALWARKFVLDVRRTAEWDELADRGVALAERMGDQDLCIEWHDFRLTMSLWLGDIGRVDVQVKILERLVEEAPHPVYRWHLRAMQAMRALHDGRFEDAERFADEVLALGGEISDEIAVQVYGALSLAIRDHQGRLEELESVLADFVEQHPEMPSWRSALVYVYTRMGREAEAREQLERTAARDFADLPHDYNWLLAVSCLARACWALGDADRSAVLCEMLEPYAGLNVTAGANAVSMGSASLPLAMLAATAGRTDDAVRHFEAAVRHNDAMGNLPWAARTRHRFAELLLEIGDPDRARATLAQAVETYDRLGMETFVEEADPLPSGAGGPAATGERRFERVGEYWEIAFDGEVAQLKDTKGLRYFAVLLGRPGSEVHVLDLIGLAEGRGVPGPVPGIEDGLHVDTGGGTALLDEEAKRAFRERVVALREDIEEAEAFNDLERAARGRAELEAIERELARAVGLGGRDRKPTAGAERARVNATRAIRSALDRIEDALPELGEHLRATISTGTFCGYTPDPAQGVCWRL